MNGNIWKYLVYCTSLYRVHSRKKRGNAGQNIKQNIRLYPLLENKRHVFPGFVFEVSTLYDPLVQHWEEVDTFALTCINFN